MKTQPMKTQPTKTQPKRLSEKGNLAQHRAGAARASSGSAATAPTLTGARRHSTPLRGGHAVCFIIRAPSDNIFTPGGVLSSRELVLLQVCPQWLCRCKEVPAVRGWIQLYGGQQKSPHLFLYGLNIFLLSSVLKAEIMHKEQKQHFIGAKPHCG